MIGISGMRAVITPPVLRWRANLDDRIAKALQADPDYSDAFMERMRSLGDAVAAEAGCTFRYERPGDYTRAAVLHLYLDDRGNSVTAESRTATTHACFYLSSRGDLYAIRCWIPFILGAGWRPAQNEELSRRVKALLRRVSRALEVRGFQFVPDEVGYQPADGHRTELDDAPATVFEVLFCEV